LFNITDAEIGVVIADVERNYSERLLSVHLSSPEKEKSACLGKHLGIEEDNNKE
jgi:hypothetical protein